VEHRTISTSFLQRRLGIGYPRAARIMDLLEQQGVVAPGEPGKSRKVQEE
jgi:S-DNA-T family DNA segregation ATPase FtsK/SpoIIIE